jgi:DNA-binding transcriptional MerR regulator
MPEPYYEVMKYYEAGRKSVESPAMLVTNVGAAASGIVSSLLTAEAGRTLDTLKEVIKDYLGRNIEIASVLRDMTITDIPAQLENLMEIDYKNIIDLVKGGIGQGVGGIHGSLYETLNGTNALVTGYNGLVQRIGIDPFISRWVNQTVRPNIPDTDAALFMLHIGALTVEQRNEYISQNGWSDEFIPALEAAFLSAPPISVLLDFKRRGYVDDAFLTEWLARYRFSGDTIDNIKKLSVQYPEPYRLAEMHSKGLLTHDQYISTMAKFGIEYDFAAAWFSAQLQMPTFDQCMIMYRRGIINEDDFKLYMNLQSYGDWQIEQMLLLKDVIPPIQDLIRFAVREAYLDHDPEKQYGEMVNIAGKMGLTKEASEWYWYAHWDRIPVNLMFANYHRGLWDVDKLARMLKIVDIHPDDRQDIINVAYGPPNVRELGYGWDVGVYTEEDVEKYRRMGGLSPEDAKKAATSLVAYRTEAERNSVRTELMYAYGFDRIDKDTLKARLTEIKTPVEALELWMTRAELYRERIRKPAMDVEGRIVSSSEALTAFKLGLRNEEWTRAQLKALDWIDERINVAVERAKVEMAEKEAEKEVVKYRKLTVAQLKQMYTVKMITKEQMTTEIVIMGYSPDDAELLTEIYTREEPVEVKPKLFTTAMSRSFYEYMVFDEDDVYYNFLEQGWDETKASMLTMLMVLEHEYPLLRIQYENGTISGEDMVKELVKLEMSELDARTLVKETYRELQIKRLTSEKDLTKAEIIKGVKNMVLTTSQGAELLQDIGYDENEAWYILAINKVVAAGDPEGYWEMRRVTESYKKAKGEKYMEIPDEAIMLEKEIKKVKAQIDELKKTTGNEQAIADLLQKLNTLELSMKTLVTQKKLK